jgi:hypothetical protein
VPVGPDGLSAGSTKTTLEAALKPQMFERLVYDRREWSS